MTNTTERFLIHRPCDDSAVADGFQWLGDYADENGHRDAAVAINTLGMLDNLARAVPQEARMLRGARAFRYGDATVRLITSRSMARVTGPVLAVWPTDGFVGKIDDLRPAAICAVPWLNDAVNQWVRTWSPTNLDRDGEDVSLSLSPVVQVALAHMVDLLDDPISMHGSYEHDAVTGTLRRLHLAREPFDPAEVENYCRRAGIRADVAADIRDVAERAARGVKLKLYSPLPRNDDVVERWRQEADERERTS